MNLCMGGSLSWGRKPNKKRMSMWVNQEDETGWVSEFGDWEEGLKNGWMSRWVNLRSWESLAKWMKGVCGQGVKSQTTDEWVNLKSWKSLAWMSLEWKIILKKTDEWGHEFGVSEESLKTRWMSEWVNLKSWKPLWRMNGWVNETQHWKPNVEPSPRYKTRTRVSAAIRIRCVFVQYRCLGCVGRGGGWRVSRAARSGPAPWRLRRSGTKRDPSCPPSPHCPCASWPESGETEDWVNMPHRHTHLYLPISEPKRLSPSPR